MNTKSNRILFIILGALLVVALYFLIPKRPFLVDSGHQLAMGTFARVVVIAADRNTADRCTEAAFAEIYKVDELMSRYKSDSQINKVNRDGSKRAVEVSDSVYEVLQRSVEISKLSDGAFDITVGPLVELFRSAEKKEAAPSKEEIAQAKSKVGYEKLKLDDHNKTVRLTVEGMQLDLGGIAKGYAVDKAIEAAQKAGAVGAMVDIGGDILCFGKAPKGKESWLIGLKNPSTSSDAEGRDIVLTLRLKDSAVATSGDYQQFVLIKDKRYSHIINRQTGTSAEGLSSVTIIADNATDADALATAVSVMGAEKGFALIEKLPNTEAILIPKGMTKELEYELIKTSGAEKCIK